MATLNINMYVPVQAAPIDYVPRWTKDGSFNNSLEITSEYHNLPYGCNVANTDCTNPYYIDTQTGVSGDGKLIFYIPIGYTINAFYRYVNGVWIETRDTENVHIDATSAEHTGQMYTDYIRYDYDGGGDPNIERVVISFDIEIDSSSIPDAQVTETNI